MFQNQMVNLHLMWLYNTAFRACSLSEVLSTHECSPEKCQTIYLMRVVDVIGYNYNFFEIVHMN